MGCLLSQGKECRESAESENENHARKRLKTRLGEIRAGKFIYDEWKLTLEHLVGGLKVDYRMKVVGGKMLPPYIQYLAGVRNLTVR